jgi:transglutaminase-like putative cysteine protease
MDGHIEDLMDNGLGRLAGLAAFVLMVARMSRLLDTSEQAPQWQLIMVAAALLGGVVWWLLGQLIRNRRIQIAVFVVLGVALFLRTAVPHTLVAGFFPTLETPAELGRELGQAMDLIRYGVAPVFPTPGLIGVLAVLMWAIGALYAWGAGSGPTWAMVIPSLALYLQFAVMDRAAPGRGWLVASITAISLGVAAIALDRRDESGRLRDSDGRPLPRRAGVVTVIAALLVGLGALYGTTASAGLVPASGNLQWRLGGGYGPGFGGVAFDRLADLQQRIITRSNAQLFRARLSDNAPPAEEVYWRMESLDIFDGERWRPSLQDAEFYTQGSAGGDPDYSYQGTTETFTSRVQIDLLRSPVVPTAGIAQVLQSDNIDVNGFQTTPDGSVLYQAQLGQGDEYQVETVFPVFDADLGALASLPDGTLSPMFANAAEAGEFSAQPAPPPAVVNRPDDLDRFIQLPTDTPLDLLNVARRETLGATTDFERAWLLENWFRESGDFVYSTNVSTGHAVLDLEAWLTDPTSLNYRTGYCEQFAAAMAVLGRALEIPSRVVWGFTPGEVRVQEDGSEVIVVRDNNAHAWVEMWMDGYGWVKFDPTPRGDGTQPESMTAQFDPVAYLPPPDPDASAGPDRPGFIDDSLTDGVDSNGNPIDGGGALPDLSGWWWVLPVLAAITASVPLFKLIRRQRRKARLSDGDVTAAWEEIVDRLADLGDPIPEHETPLEFAARTDRRLIPLARSYSAAVYGGRNGNGSSKDLDVVDRWIKQSYQEAERTVAAFRLKSLTKRD